MLNYWLNAVCVKLLFSSYISNLCHSIIVVCVQPGFSTMDSPC